ncbi:MAG: FAD-binding oxidoreductase, partial [Ignavibacteriae bacterium]|nr:FAD-binding oxidoreductase [Ignavibacteriota bacterium]
NDKSDFESYLSDAANVKGDCEGIYFPENENEIVELIKKANNENLKITISAGRTGLNGGCVPENGILISTEKLNKVIEINTENKCAVVEPGVVLSDLQKEVEKVNLFYPPDPTETNCFIGGTVVNNSSGARTFKYGPTRNFVEEISVILPNGEKVEIKRNENYIQNYLGKISFENRDDLRFVIPNYKMPNVKHAAGYYCKENMDLIDLFIGSEGTLGVITKIKLKLIELPKNILSMIIFFNSESDLFNFVNETRNLSVDKTNIIDLREIEFFDHNTLKILKSDYPNIPDNTNGAVWIEQEFEQKDEENLLLEIDEQIQKFNGDAENIWFALNEKEREKLKEFRHKIALKVNDIISERGLLKVGTDNAVPNEKFSEFYEFTKNLIMEHNLDYVVYGHIGNSHLHFNMLPKDRDELTLCRKLYGEICRKSVELGGTISAEHGIGKLKTKYLVEMFGEENILQMAKLKKNFDPNMILNVGNMFEKKYLQMV